jgi:VWFA-related protein
LSSYLSAVGQEKAAVRVCVALPQMGADTVSAVELRDRMIRALNKEKPHKKLGQSVMAVGLEETLGNKASSEAKEKDCEFVLSMRVADVQTSSIVTADSMEGLIPVPVFHVALEYQLTLARDGAAIAIGSVKEKGLTSLRDVVWQAVAQAADEAVADIRKGADGTQGQVSQTTNSTAATSARQNQAGAGEADLCGWLSADIPHVEALQGVCEYAISLQGKMPNFICEQAASRYRGKDRVPTDLVTASVRYEDGNESYSEIRVNGQAASVAAMQSSGLWSTGEFGSNNLLSIFNARNHAVFQFSGERKLGNRSAWVFAYQISKQNEPLWRLHGGDQVIAPPYRGELWVDKSTGDMMRFESVANDMPKSFVITEAGLRIDYGTLRFGDGPSLVLPTDFTVTTGLQGQQPTRNVVQLRNCHEFRAKARLVLGADAGSSGANAAATASAAAIENELNENNEIYEILRAQALREDAASLEREQRQELEAATVGALRRLTAIEREQHKSLANAEVTENALPLPTKSGEGVTTFKASVRLVPVSVVLRDAKGHVVGDVPKDDFHLFDERKPQVITSFSMEQVRATGARDGSGQGLAPDQSALEAKSGAIPGGEQYVAYIFDDVHSALEDWASAKNAAMRHLAELRAEDRAAIFSISGIVQLDFTNDREKLLGTVRGMKARPIPPGSDCPPISYYTADLMINKNDSGVLAQAVDDTVACAKVPATIAQRMVTGKAFEVLNAGEQESRQSLNVLRDVIRRTAAMPGRKGVVLISPGFLTPESDMLESMTNLIDQAIRSEIVINALDLRGLYTVGADAGSMTPHAGSTGQTEQSDALAELAGGTGGTFFRNNNDLSEGFRRVATPPEYIYVLGFSPQKLDGKFHRLKVTMTTAEKLKVQAREGYYAPKTASN